ncbi:MAG: hypothetical protein ACI8PZ_000850 [Myxococcota bacterium]|jgi:hypothetical protein
MPRRNNRYYDLLEVSPTAERRGLEIAFRRVSDRLSRRGDDDDAKRRLSEVQEAWAVLSDPGKRALYDQHGEQAFETGFQPPAPTAPQPGAPQGAPGQVPPPMGGPPPPGWQGAPWGQQQGGWPTPPPGPPPGAWQQPPPGWTPQGQQWQQPPPGAAPAPSGPSHVGPIEVWVPFKLACLGGRQEVLVGSDLVDVPVTPGAQTGQVVSYRGRQFKLHVEESDTFLRNGLNLHLTLVVEEHDADRGCERTIPTLDKHRRIEIPDGTLDGDTVTVKGGGIRVPGEIGDLVVDIVVKPGAGPAGDGRVRMRATKKPSRSQRPTVRGGRRRREADDDGPPPAKGDASMIHIGPADDDD